MNFIDKMRLYETQGLCDGSPRDLVGDAADEIEQLQGPQPCVCPKCGGRGTYENGSFTLKE